MLKRSVLLAVPLAALVAATVLVSPAKPDEDPPAGGSVANFSRINPPLPAPGAAFRDSAGKEIHLADFRGKLVLLNIWATWCAPCRAEMPSLDRLQAKLGGEGLLVVPVSLDRGGGPVVAVFYGQHAIGHLGVYLDGKGALESALKINGVPTSFLIDRQGRVVGSLEGATQWDTPEALALLRSYLAKPATQAKTMPAAYRAGDQRVGVGFSPL
jgi:thiol-disulfide isomerase/thioredoxin